MMRLYYANTSPYARKARMMVLEKGLSDRVTMVFANPFEENPELKAANPLNRIPALTLDNGSAIYDSPVICAYLDAQGDGPSLFGSGTEVWRQRTAEALCDGMLDGLFAIVMERRRPEAEQSAHWQDRWQASFFGACDEAQRQMPLFEGPISIAQLALGSALGYADFRTPDIDWRSGRSQLADWYKVFSARDSMIATDPTITA